MKRMLYALLLPLVMCLSSCATLGPASPREVARVQAHAVMIHKLFAVVLPDGLALKGAQGTGVVIGTDGDYDVLLTAGHVCEMPTTVRVKLKDGVVIDAPTAMSLYRVIDRHGKSHPLEIVRISDTDDLCLAKYKGHAAEPASLADAMPQVGEWVEMPAAPAQIWHPEPEGTVLVLDGRYMGMVMEGTDGAAEKRPYAMYSMPVYGGASGSGVFCHGRLVGILTAGDSEFEHASYGVPLKHVREFLGK